MDSTYGPRKQPDSELLAEYEIEIDSTYRNMLHLLEKINSRVYVVVSSIMFPVAYYNGQFDIRENRIKIPEYDEIICKCPYEELLPETKKVVIRAYLNCTLTIEQFARL